MQCEGAGETDERLLATGFTAHNIILPDGSQTRPGEPPLAESESVRAALRTALRICPPHGAIRPRVVDLGCLEGGYAVEFARAGYEVIGIEARSDSVARCNYVRSRLGLDHLTFVQDDVRNVAKYGPFDIVVCYGLLYHLEKPLTFLKLLGHLTRHLLLLHTHYAEEQFSPTYPLSEICENEGARGRWYPETVTTGWQSVEHMEGQSWASWLNTASFWPMKPHLLEAIRGAGFDIVCEQFDALEDIVGDAYTQQHSRCLFTAIKAANPLPSA